MSRRSTKFNSGSSVFATEHTKKNPSALTLWDAILVPDLQQLESDELYTSSIKDVISADQDSSFQCNDILL